MLTLLAIIFIQLAVMVNLLDDKNFFVKVSSMALLVIANILLFHSLKIEAGLLFMLFLLGFIPLINIVGMATWGKLKS